LLTQPIDSGDTGQGAQNQDDGIFDAASSILNVLPSDFDVDAARRKDPVKRNNSIQTVLCQELGRINVLLHGIRTSLVELKKADSGTVLWSPFFATVRCGRISHQQQATWLSLHWCRAWYAGWKCIARCQGTVCMVEQFCPLLKGLGSYRFEVTGWCAFFASCMASEPPTVFWLPAFFFTQAFLTVHDPAACMSAENFAPTDRWVGLWAHTLMGAGAKQNFARMYVNPIDTIDFDFYFKVHADGCQPYQMVPDDGLYVTGMFLEGAAWDDKKHELIESGPSRFSLHLYQNALHAD
jgi:dynein heavy chain, axonemal